MTKPLPKCPTQIDARIGMRLQMLRVGHRMTRGVLSRRLGISSAQVLKHELGLARVEPSLMFEIAHLFDVPVTAFFEGLL
jgi:transcriptional regulator with XRE-family HTH domain